MAATVIVTSGFIRGWTALNKILLVMIVLSGLLRLLGLGHIRKTRRFKAMTPEEREQFFAQQDPKMQHLLREQLERFRDYCWDANYKS